MADPARCNVSDQESDPNSVLAFTRRAIARRSANEDLAVGNYATVPSPAGTWVFRRGARTTVALNLSDRSHSFEGQSWLAGTVTLATGAAIEGGPVDGAFRLAPWSGAVLES